MSAAAIKVLEEKSILLVFCCTLIGAAAQVLFKLGAMAVQRPTPISILTNPSLFSGYCLYGLSTCLLILALRKGQLSLLYPVIALTYVWVALLSMVFFNESLNPWKALGLATVVAGVALLGRGSRS